MELTVRFVGVIRDGGVNSRVLVRAEDGFFYVWRVSSREVVGLRGAGVCSVPAGELELASEQEVVVGRDAFGKASVGSVRVEFCGVVGRGKTNFRALVLEPGGSRYCTVVIPVGDLPEKGSLVEVSQRLMSDAREDQIEAGLGLGRLRRGPRRKRAVQEG
jgi:hypothetical protein